MAGVRLFFVGACSNSVAVERFRGQSSMGMVLFAVATMHARAPGKGRCSGWDVGEGVAGVVGDELPELPVSLFG